MIISIRNQFKHSSFRYVSMFIVLVIALSVVTVPLIMKQEGATWAVKINGDKISYKDFAQEVAEQSQFLANIRAQYGQYADLLFQAMGWPTDPKFLAYESLIRLSLLNQFVRRLGIVIDERYIGDSINNAEFARKHLQNLLPAEVFGPSGTMDMEKLRMYLQYKGISHKDFEYKIEQSLEQLQAVQFISSTCYVPLFDIKQEIIAHKLGKQFSYLTFSFDTFLDQEKNKEVTDDQALSFYEKENIKNRRYYVPEKRDGIVYTFSSADYNSEISEEQINEYYEDNKVKSYILDPIKVEVQQLSEKQIPSDTSLDQLATELVANPSLAKNYTWQKLEPFARTDKKGKFSQEAFLLQNEGDISPVIEVDGQKVILQLIRRIPRTYKSLDTVRNEIKALLQEKQFKKNFVKNLKEMATKGDEAIEEFIRRKGGKKEVAMGIMKNDTRLSQELFDLKKGNYSFYVDNNKGHAVILTNITERHLPPFDSIKDIVKNDVREDKAQIVLMEAVKNAKRESATRSFSELAKEFGASLSKTDMIFPHNSQQMQELDKKGLPSRIIMNLDKKDLVLSYYGDRAAYLIKLDELESYDSDKFIQAEEEIKKSLTDYRLKGHVESTVASLHRNATIETNESIIITNEDYSE